MDDDQIDPVIPEEIIDDDELDEDGMPRKIPPMADDVNEDDEEVV